MRTSAIPTTMKASAVDRFGPPSALKLHEVPVPKPHPHEVLIAIHTAGIGSWDTSIRDGSWRRSGPPKFPLIPGVDGVGTVVAKGARVRRFAVGDEVYAYEFGNPRGGFYAQFAVADAQHVSPVPKGLDIRAAGAAATTGLTAMQGIDKLDKVERCLDFVQPQGRVVHPNGIEPEPIARRTFRIRSFDAVASPREFAKLQRRIDGGKIRVPITAVYPLAHAADAHRHLDRGHVLGRMVFGVRR